MASRRHLVLGALAMLAMPGGTQARYAPATQGLRETRCYPRHDGHADWQVTIVRPAPAWPAPVRGWPVIYLLDGNAVMQALPEALRALPRALRAASWHGQAGPAGLAWPGVLVAVGYDTAQRFDVNSRAWDYTPLPLATGVPTPDPRAPQRTNGGANGFLAFLLDLHASLAAEMPLDPRRRTLYGHSYGGLFVLHALLQRPDAYDRYVAASPSLWWHAPDMFERQRHARRRSQALPPARVLVLAGQQERLRASRGQPADSGRPTQDHAAAFVQELARRQDVQARLRILPGKSHGEMLAASLPEALAAAMQP